MSDVSLDTAVSTSGSTARTLAVRFADEYSIEDFGVVNDPSGMYVTANTLAYQAAINAASGVARLRHRAGISVVVNGLTVTGILYWELDGKISLANHYNGPVIYLSNVIDAYIGGKGTIDGNKANNTFGSLGGAGILTNSGTSPALVNSNITVSGLIIQNCVNWPISIAACSGVWVENCQFLNSGNAPQFTNGTTNCWATNNYSYNIPDYGWAFYEGCSHGVASGNLIVNCAAFGILSDGAASGYGALPQHDIILVDNTIINATAYAIMVHNYTGSSVANAYNVLISQNNIQNSGSNNTVNATGIYITTAGNNIVVENNLIVGGGSSSGGYNGIHIEVCSFTIVRGNKIFNPGIVGTSNPTGIYFDLTSNLNIHDNFIIDSRATTLLAYGIAGSFGIGSSCLANYIYKAFTPYNLVLASDTIFSSPGQLGWGTVDNSVNVNSNISTNYGGAFDATSASSSVSGAAAISIPQNCSQYDVLGSPTSISFTLNLPTITSAQIAFTLDISFEIAVAVLTWSTPGASLQSAPPTSVVANQVIRFKYINGKWRHQVFA